MAAGLVVAVAGASIALALRLTPMQSVRALGETVDVGVTAPSASLSGPGELDLFGQSFPTVPDFTGPVRPRLELAQITIDREVRTLVQPRQGGRSPVTFLGEQLTAGWMRFFLWEALITAVCAVVLLGAIAGWRRLSVRTSVLMVTLGLLFTEGINLGLVMVSAYSAPSVLRHVSSLEALVGTYAPIPKPAPSGAPLPGVQVVVMGDSTAAGTGNPPITNATAVDSACGRSVDSYGADLAVVNGWNVLNLACSGATITHGILGPQTVGGQVVPPQFGVAEQARHASVVIVSVGADDLDWDALVRLCASQPSCDDNASTALFQQLLAVFTPSYDQLLRALAALPSHPAVIVNLYYQPFDPELRCLDRVGLTGPKEQVLRSRLSTLNQVLAQGASTFGFIAVQPRFTGHQLCSAQPYVQGLHDPAPFHPTASGELAIALADERALSSARPLGR